ncbi:hypothetical protein AXW83_20135 [Bosea sp. PAMC 26642]|nr:hypothetical protein AXW83_20135 [Bosea sp. PAMC 26642]
MIDTVIVGAVAGLGVAVGPSLLRPSVIIEPINVPSSLEERGYSGEVVARRLRDELRDIFATARPTILTSLKLSDVAVEQRLPDIEVPGGLNLRSIVSTIRELLDLNDIYVSGELTVDRRPDNQLPKKPKTSDEEDVEKPEVPPSFVLKLRSRNTGPFYQTKEPTEDLQAAFRSAAVAILEISNPSLAGRHFEMQRQYDDAARIARLLIASNKVGEAENGLILRGNVSLRRQDYDAAIKDFEEVLKRNPQNVLAAVNIAWANFRAGRYDATIASAERAIAIDPKAASAHAHKANALRMLGRAREAAEIAQGAVDLEPTNGQPLTALAAAYNAMRRPREALEIGLQAVERDPNYGSAHLVLAVALNNLGRGEEALPRYKKAVDLDPTYSRAWYAYAQALKRAKQWPEALLNFEEAVKREPDNMEYVGERGLVLSEMLKHGDAIPPLQRALDSGYRPAVTALALGRSQLALKRLSEAIANFDRSTSIDSRNAEAWLEWGQALIKSLQPADADKVLARAREKLPGNGILAKLHGDALLAIKDDQRALDAYETAVRLDQALAQAVGKTITRLRKKRPQLNAKLQPKLAP